MLGTFGRLVAAVGLCAVVAFPAVAAPPGYFFQNKTSGLYLDGPAVVVPSPAQVYMWRLNGGTSQTWRFRPAGAGYYTIQEASSGYYLTSHSERNELGVFLSPYTSSPNQRWQIGKSTDGYTLLKNKGLCLESNDGGVVFLSNYTGVSSQKWVVRPAQAVVPGLRPASKRLR